MQEIVKPLVRQRAWRILLIQTGFSALVILAALATSLLLLERNLALATTLGAAVVVLAASLLSSTRMLRLLDEARKAIDKLTIYDELTGLPNRIHFYDRLDAELDRARRYGNPLSLIMVDIDHFKKVNTEYGHPLGDLALSQVARLLDANVRTSDIVARYGGEEFAIILPETTAEQAATAAEKLRIVVEVNDISMEGPEVKVTISCGVAELSDVRVDNHLRDNFILATDRALTRAKTNGRNQVAQHVPAP